MTASVLLFQASEGVPVKYFENLEELIEYYKKENMGLVWHLKYPVPREEEEAADELEEDAGKKPMMWLGDADPWHLLWTGDMQCRQGD